MRLRDKIQRVGRPVVVYEILPPRIIDGTIESYAENISTLLSKTHIDAINIPEVHMEETRGVRPVAESLRAEPREFGQLIQDAVGIEAIVNRVTVHESVEEQSAWFQSTHDDYGIENIVLVGGESSNIEYLGPSVVESSELINQINSESGREIFCGGIAIPSRKVESLRLLKKGANGIEYFTTQVLYDSDNISKMLGHYQDACIKAKVSPKRILLSFAPISTEKNLNFLKWLGVNVPDATENYITANPNTIKDRSFEVSMGVLDDIISHISSNKIAVPIGLNIEHIMSYNFDHSVELLQMMSKSYRKFCIETDLFDDLKRPQR